LGLSGFSGLSLLILFPHFREEASALAVVPGDDPLSICLPSLGQLDVLIQERFFLVPPLYVVLAPEDLATCEFQALVALATVDLLCCGFELVWERLL